MIRDLSPGELAALELAAQWERECWAMYHPRDDAAFEAWTEYAQERSAIEAEGNGRMCADVFGLVSVPTTQKRCSPSLFRLRADVQAAQHSLGAFAPDRTLARLSQLRRAVGFSARAHGAEAPLLGQCLMLTLTYREDGAWRADHIRALMDHVRKFMARRGAQCRYVWVAELTKRLRLHYHIAIWLPPGVHLPFADAQGWWPHGMTRTEVARAAVPYLLKYLSKGTDVHRLPRGCRSYGVGGLSHEMRRARRWLGLPKFVQERSDIHDDWRRAPGPRVPGCFAGPAPGGWLEPRAVVDGVVQPGPQRWFASEFRQLVVGWQRSFVRVHTHPSTGWSPDGPFSWIDRGRLQ